MTEIKTITKVSLLVYAIVCALYGIMAIFLPGMMEAFLGPMDPFQPRLFGGVLFVITIQAFLIIFKKDWDWEQVKLGYLVLYSLLLSTIIMEGSVTALLFSTLSAEAVSMHVFDLIIMPVLLILGLYSYTKQSGQKKRRRGGDLFWKESRSMFSQHNHTSLCLYIVWFYCAV